VTAVVDVQLGVEAAEVAVHAARPLGRRVVAQLRVLDEAVRHVDAKAVDPAIEPEAEDVEHGRLDLGVAPVQVRLLGVEQVQVVLPGLLVQRPGRAAPHPDPVVGRRAVRLAVAPDVPVALRIVARAPRLDEPCMLVGAVVRHDIDHHRDAERVRARDQPIEGGEVAEPRIDIDEVAHVVAAVGQRRGVERRDPDGVHSQPGQVVEARQDAGQVADPVAVRVLKAPRVDLVDGPALPPRRRAHRTTRRTAPPARQSGSWPASMAS